MRRDIATLRTAAKGLTRNTCAHLRLSQSSRRISMETLDADLKSLRSRMISLEENAAASCLGAVLECWRQLQEEGGELIDFFCEDQETFRLDDCFSIFNTFCCRFTAAIKENQEREVKEAKEAAHRRRLQELEEHKRHSWAGGEQVGGALGSRCSSERDVSAALPRQDRAALLVELLTTKPRPRGCSGRRSRIFPSSSPSNATGCQQDPLLGTTPPAHKLPPHRGPETPSDPPSASCLLQSHDISLANQVDATSDINQQSDHHNNAGAERGDSEALSDRQVQSDSGPEKTGTREVDPDLKERGNPERFEDLVPARLSVVVEKCTLVPRLKVFDGVLHTSSVRGHHQGDVDLEDDPLDPEKGQRSSPPQEGEEGEGKVNVWCVTGVCEAAGELSDSIHVGTKKNQPSSNNQGDPTSSSVPANHSPSAPQPANEKPAPLPISSQPAPVLNHLSSSRWRPVDWVSTGADPEEAVVPTNQRKETVGDQSTNDRSRTKTSCPLTNERTGASVQTVQQEPSSL
ncbi:hypothetical protein fugu_002105 [Takifugu bimaculatus]|uniref:FH2 domain-containing protein n=1 Tax=Takifugu bimaculatus TaxID=433685 RepID=A0A4Z2BPE7_9TELE|nr:hypothetical protein fugu_002105 [Takifugu bimaculatus]